MSISNELWFANPGADAYEIDYSCRFNDDDTAHLSRTPSGDGTNTKIWTFSTWLKRANIGSTSLVLFSAGVSGYETLINIRGSVHNLEFYQGVGSTVSNIQSNMKFRDPSAWYHIVVGYDSTQGSSTDRITYEVNGVTVSFTENNAVDLNRVTDFNTTDAHYLFRRITNQFPLDGYVAETIMVDGQKLAATSFGEFSSTTGQWVPIDPSSLTFGTNGFYLDFADASDLGNDVSGNNNDWTSSGLATNDQMIDTPTNNFCTWNPIYKPNRAGGLTNFDNTAYSDGNLRCTRKSGSYNAIANGTMTVFGGSDAPKIYYEHTPTTWGGAIALYVGWEEAGKSILIEGSDNVPNYFYINGRHTTNAYESFQYPGGSTDNYATFGQGTVIGVAVDFANDVITYYANNTQLFSLDASGLAALSGITLATFAGRLWRPYSGFGNDAGPPTTVTNFGQTPFTYTPPTGYVGLSTANLPDPAIKDPSAHFQATLYTGNATASRAITQDGSSTFGPDMVWIKNRDQADEWKALDTTRGATKELNLDSTNAESTDANGLTAFSGTDGFTLGTGAGGYNDNSEDFIAYQWEKGVTHGFDIVAYTGNGSTQEISHGLGVLPDFLFVKSLDETRHITPFHSALGATHYGEIDRNVPFGTGNANLRWGNNSITVEPTSSVFTIGNSIDVNENTKDYIAYLFAAVDSFSAFGSYVGNGSSDGPMVNLGFKPAMIIFKQTNSSSSDWPIWDNKRDAYNLSKYTSFLALTQAEQSNIYIDLLSNGVKIRSTNSQLNGSGSTYIYMAWAETPFKTATAR